MNTLAQIWFRLGASLPLVIAAPLRGQCSDAGICRLNATPKPDAWGLGLNLQSGASGQPDGLQFRSMVLEAQAPLWSGGSLSGTLPFHRISGPLGQVSGVGDAVFVLDQQIVSGGAWSLSSQLGARLATGKANGEPLLPQSYQTGLGPPDLLAGLRFSLDTWALGVGYQKAGGRSEHAQRLQRGDDALGWVHWRLPLNQFAFGLKALAIQRLQASSFSEDGAIREVPDSKRLQVNISAQVAWTLRPGTDLVADLTAPLLKRPQNVDGLKRANTLSAGFRWQF